MNGIEFLEVSHDYQLSSNMSKLRTAISRSYYALYHHIIETWEAAGWDGIFIKKVRDSHGRLLTELKKYHEYAIIKDAVKRLKKWRTMADYELSEEIDSDILNQTLAKSALARSESARDTFDRCNHGDARNAIGNLTVTNEIPP